MTKLTKLVSRSIPMHDKERKQRLLDTIKELNEVSVNDLIKLFDVSGMTIRRDLMVLEEQKLIKRSYGKVTAVSWCPIESTFEIRSSENLKLKRYIAFIAAEYLQNISSIFIDGSSTCKELVKCIPKTKKISVFTNSIESFMILKEMSNVKTFIFGGFLASDHNTLDGDCVLNLAKTIFVDAVFISCSGFSIKGIVNNGISGAQLKTVMLENSYRNFLLADHTKFNSRGLYQLGTWNQINCFITDEPISEELSKVLLKAGVEIRCK